MEIKMDLLEIDFIKFNEEHIKRSPCSCKSPHKQFGRRGFPPTADSYNPCQHSIPLEWAPRLSTDSKTKSISVLLCISMFIKNKNFDIPYWNNQSSSFSSCWLYCSKIDFTRIFLLHKSKSAEAGKFWGRKLHVAQVVDHAQA